MEQNCFGNKKEKKQKASETFATNDIELIPKI